MVVLEGLQEWLCRQPSHRHPLAVVWGKPARTVEQGYHIACYNNVYSGIFVLTRVYSGTIDKSNISVWVHSKFYGGEMLGC